MADALVCINGICGFQTKAFQQTKSSQSDKKNPSKGPFSYKLHLYRFRSCWHSYIILIIIAYISMDLNFLILADTFTELGLILVTFVYHYVNISLGLKIQHDLQCTNFSLDCPKGAAITSVALVYLHIATSCRQVQDQKTPWAVPPPPTFTNLQCDVDCTCMSKAGTEEHQGTTLH